MSLDLLFLLAGLVLLVKGADALISGSTSLARRFGIPNLLVGLTIVAFGTSAPELVVNLVSSFKGTSEVAIGNITGSNIANIALILGMSALVYPIVVRRETVWKQIPRNFFAAALLFVLANDVLIDGSGANVVGRSDGIVLLLFFNAFIYYVFQLSKNGGLIGFSPGHGMPPELREERSPGLTAALIVGGLAALALGGKLVVDGAVSLAAALGVSQRVIGASIIAVGTSLPELATSVIAAYRKQADIAVGNIIGSNIFNIYFILGLSALIRPLPYPPSAIVDSVIMMGVTALLFLFVFIGKKHELERWQGLALLLCYVGYLGFLFGRA